MSNKKQMPAKTSESNVNSDVELLRAQIEQLQARNLELEAKKSKSTKKPKGEPVTFTNQKGEQILGYGVLYYVVRMNGKLHYKETSSVTKITEAELEDLQNPNFIDLEVKSSK